WGQTVSSVAARLRLGVAACCPVASRLSVFRPPRLLVLRHSAGRLARAVLFRTRLPVLPIQSRLLVVAWDQRLVQRLGRLEKQEGFSGSLTITRCLLRS